MTYKSESGLEVQIDARLSVEELATVIKNFEGVHIIEYDEFVTKLDRYE